MKKITQALIVALFFFLLAQNLFSFEHAVLIGSVALLVTLWTNEALPLGVVSLLPLILFPSLGILDLNHTAPNYSKSIIFLFLGGFMLALAIEKTGLHRYFSAKLLSFFPHTPRGIIYALAITSALLSSILSNTTITLMLMPIALYLSDNPTLKVRFLLATAYGASIGGILTPIGTAPNLILLGFLEEQGLGMLAFGEWMLYMTPVVALMLLLMPLLISHGVKDEPLQAKSQEPKPLEGEQKRLYLIFIALAALLVLNTFGKQLFGFALNEKLILLGFGLAMFLPKPYGFLSWEDARKIPYEIIFLFGAGFSIAAAFMHTGLAEEIAKRLDFILEQPYLVMLFIVAFFVTFSTEITSNTALTSIAIPIFYAFVKELAPEQGIIMLMVATVAASYAFMLPIATPPNAIVMSSGVIKIKQMAKVGFVLNLIGITVLVSIAYLFWPLFI